MKPTTEAVRKPWVATALSLLSAGLGHVYCGRIAKGLLLYFAWFLLPALCFLASLLAPSTSVLVGFILLPVAVMLGVYVYAAIDAFLVAKREPDSYQLKDYNRTGIYLMMLAVYLIGPISLTAAVREFAYEAFYVPTNSMSPSIVAGDRVLVNKVRPRQTFPTRGTLVVFRNPAPEGAGVFIKRVVAVAGDQLVIDADQVEVNGKPLQRDPLPRESLGSIRSIVGAKAEAYEETNAGRRYRVMLGEPKVEAGRVETVVPDRCVFVLGDNRQTSRDSRHFGPVHLGDVVGYVDYIYYPAGDWSRFGVCEP